MGVRVGSGGFEQLPKRILPYMFPELGIFYLINDNERMQIYPKIRVDDEVSYLSL